MVVPYCWRERTSTELARTIKDMQDIVYELKTNHHDTFYESRP